MKNNIDTLKHMFEYLILLQIISSFNRECAFYHYCNIMILFHFLYKENLHLQKIEEQHKMLKI